MASYDIDEVKAHFTELLARVMRGEEVIIAKAGKPVARIVPIAADQAPRKPGIDAGKIMVAPDFDDPLPEFDAD